MCDFKVGDYVACKIDKYGITTKGRPCRVKNVVGNEITVFCFGDSDCYNVPKDDFAILENFKPFEFMEKVMFEGKLYKFNSYYGSGYILIDESEVYRIPYSELHKLHKVGGMFI